MQRIVRKKRVYPGADIERVWEALTIGKKLDNWFMENNFEGKENAQFEFFDKPGEKFKGVYNGEIISFQTPINLAYSWSHSKLKHTTYIWWKLESKGDNTILELEHSGFKGFHDFIKSYSYSSFWNKKLRELLIFLSKERDPVEI